MIPGKTVNLLINNIGREDFLYQTGHPSRDKKETFVAAMWRSLNDILTMKSLILAQDER